MSDTNSPSFTLNVADVVEIAKNTALVAEPLFWKSVILSKKPSPSLSQSDGYANKNVVINKIDDKYLQ